MSTGLEEGRGARCALYELMNSSAFGESPRRFFRCSAASAGGRVDVYVSICDRESSSKGRRVESLFRAHSEAVAIRTVGRDHGKAWEMKVAG